MIVNVSIQKNTPSNQRCVFKSYLVRKIHVFLTVRPIGIYQILFTGCNSIYPLVPIGSN